MKKPVHWEVNDALNSLVLMKGRVCLGMVDVAFDEATNARIVKAYVAEVEIGRFSRAILNEEIDLAQSAVEGAIKSFESAQLRKVAEQ